jgi:GTP-binding protein LepA
MSAHQTHYFNKIDKALIRNFSIIAHIDHGKTTLTDQLLKSTGTISPNQIGERLLDSNPIEKERGITIKLAPVTMNYNLKAISYKLNLIDTPGHVDFSYEVSRSLTACEGALVLVDATQGIQAQTLAHVKKAKDLGLILLPAINKVDLKSARVKETQTQLVEVFGFKKSEIALISAKTGEGVNELLKSLIKNLPHPKGKEDKPLRALIFNSIYNAHLGVIAFVKVVDGCLLDKQKTHLIMAKKDIEPKEIGIFSPKRTPLQQLNTGEVGFVATGLKDIRSLQVGDTLTSALAQKAKHPPAPLSGFRMPNPVVFADIYPDQTTNFDELTSAFEKLMLTDASLSKKPISSPALGSGLRLGFLGLFHSEITRERLHREHGVSSIITKPTVEYEIQTKDGKKRIIQNPSDLPEPSQIKSIKEPMVKVTIITPREYIGSLIQLLQDRRGRYLDTKYIGEQAQIIYELPLAELISGFADQLKSTSQGFASLDYKHIDPQPVDAVKLSILVNREEVEALARIVVRQNAQTIGSKLVLKLKEIFPKQLFAVPIQAAIGGKIIARETKPAARKDVTAKLYGGDRTRRMKLLAKQKKGKKKLARLGRITIPPETFTKLMKV